MSVQDKSAGDSSGNEPVPPTERQCPKFDSFTRRMFGLSDQVDLDKWEERCITESRIRRPSVAFSAELFVVALGLLEKPTLFEVGGNIGRHTRQFLELDLRCLHTFEPNPELFPNFFELGHAERFRFNPYGLSNSNGVRQFNVVKHVSGFRKGATHGMSSFEDVGDAYTKMYGEAVTEPICACHVRGDAYLETLGEPVDPLALWIDVEGHGLAVLQGFGRWLGNVDLAICELETDRRYVSEPNADKIMSHMNTHGLYPVWRDIQYYGRFNVVFVRDALREAFCRLRKQLAGEFIRRLGTLTL